MLINGLKHTFFSHQDPDIVAAANGWLMVTDTQAHLSMLWMRFIPHFGVDELVLDRIKPIPDVGITLALNGAQLKLIPAHFLHSSGNFQIYDPVSKILYSGDLGASLGNDYGLVEDFDSHVQFMEGFHKRYILTAKVLARGKGPGATQIGDPENCSHRHLRYSGYGPGRLVVHGQDGHKPLTELAHLADDISQGKQIGREIKANSSDEIGTLYASLNRMRISILKLVKAVKRV